METADYLARIGWSAPVRIDASTLADLQIAHLLAVPFENLDIPAGRRISLDLTDLEAKVVARRRGGFCYELNGLFAALLSELGFRVTLLSARVTARDGTLGPEFDHLALRVDLEEPWLVDVGFGDTFRTPIPLRAGIDQADFADRRYRLEVDGDRWTLAEHDPHRSGGAAWRPQYAFTLIPRQLAEFELMCRFQETESPHFTQHRRCTRATRTGRMTLLDNRWIVYEGDERREREVDEAEVPGLLEEAFGIVL